MIALLIGKFLFDDDGACHIKDIFFYLSNAILIFSGEI